MTWNRQTVKTILIVAVSIAFASFMIRFTADHDGQTISIGGGGGDATSQAPVTTGSDPQTGLAWVDELSLPAQAQATLRLIDSGGPFPYAKDGVVFENFEGILPQQARGYYHEYTVPTPGSDDRGARRIVTGGPAEFFWTADHYASFQRIAPGPGVTDSLGELAGLLAGGRAPGVYRWHALTPRPEVRDAVELAGWRWGYVAGWTAPDKGSFLGAIGDALAFPGHYGRNLDALWDCLTDLTEPTLLVWDSWARLARADATSFERILGVLRSRVAREPAFAVLLWGDGPVQGVPSLD